MIELRSDIDPTGLYPSQVSALQQLQTWWNSTEHEAVIEGFAGTGKTYLVKYFLKHVVNKSYIVTAPTHTALQVLERNTQVKGMTFQKLHGLKPNTELSTFDINNLNFESIGTIKLANYSLVIADESSMINSSLFKLTRARAEEYNVKILYLGKTYYC